MAQETLVVKVVPDDAPIAEPSTAHSPDRARYSSDLPVLGKSPTFPRRPLGSAQPDRRRSPRSDSSLGAASDLVWADDDDDDDERPGAVARAVTAEAPSISKQPSRNSDWPVNARN